MSKKSKRQARKPASRPAETAATLAAPAPSASINGNRPFEREFNPDYSHVIKDLKRIGTLAGSFFIILVVLSFFLR